MGDNKDFLKQFAKGAKRQLKTGGRAVIYQRVSSKEQEDGFSPETQLERCYEWASRHNYEVVKSFEGEHESAKTDANRKRFNTMLKFVMDKRNRIDAVIVYSTSRFSRTGTKSFSILDELMARDIPVFSATSSYDARTADGRMMQGVELLMAEHDNSVKSQAVRDSGAKALRAGRWIQAPPRGYDMKTTRAKQTITINADGLLIREAFLLKARENLTNEEVRKEMKTRGLDLSKQNWSHIFKNIFYAGYFSHPFLEGEIVKGPYEPLVSLEVFSKVNNVNVSSHSRGYEVKSEKAYAPLLGLMRCPVCGYKMSSALSTKMRKRYGREVGYYMCGHKNCRCNVSAKKANHAFEDWLGGIALKERFSEVLEAQLRKSLPILNEAARDAVKDIRSALSKKETEIERAEYNLAVAPSAKVMDVCSRQLEKLEEEKREIEAELAEKEQTILNLDDYISQGMYLRNNILKMWQLSNLPHKRHLQEVVFPDGVVWSKENDDIEPLSKNEFLFTFGLKSGNYVKKESGQTADFRNLSALAPPVGLEPTTL